MTSRNLFFKLMKEDLNAATLGHWFSVLALFFAMPDGRQPWGFGEIGNLVQAMADLRNRIREYGAGALRQTKILRLAGEILGFEKLCPFYGGWSRGDDPRTRQDFWYLHSKKQIDFLQQPPREEGDAV